MADTFQHPLVASVETKEVKKMSSSKLPAIYNKYDDKILAVASKYNVPWYWIKGIALNESLMGENKLVKTGAVSSDGKSYGIVQFTFPTAKDMMGREVTKEELNDVDFSFNLCGMYLNKLSKMFAGNEEKVIKSYNQGPGNTQKGKAYADPYYARFLNWKAKILS
jgi:soluble lytic murein transglycosylase-like protein